MQSGSEKRAVAFYCALAATGIFLSMAGYARGDIVKVELYGEVTSIIDPAGLLGGQVNAGDAITGFYRFDSSTADTNPLTTVGDYQQTKSPCGISLNIDDLLFASNPQNVNFLIKVSNDTDSKDSYLLNSTFNLPVVNGLEVSSIRWQLDDPTCSALSSDALVAVTPWQWQSSVLDITCRGAGGVVRIGAIIPYTQVVPEPASALMISLGFLFIGGRRGKKLNIKK